jgi:3-oxoadipate enol-lactonase
MATLEVPGARLHYRVDGPAGAPAVVLSNSLGSTLEMWDGQLPVLTRRFRVVRYDMRGHGGSSLSSVAVDLERLSRDVVDLLDGLDLDRASLCGLSLGGMVGLWLGAHAPERLNRLVVCNTAAVLGPRSAWDARIEAVNRGGMAAVAGAVVERWLTPAFRQREPAAADRLTRMLLETNPEGYVAACAAVRDMDQRATVSAVRAPTLVVAGRHDLAVPLAAARWLVEHIPGARGLDLDAAHLSNIEAEPLFNEQVFEFLSDEERANG